MVIIFSCADKDTEPNIQDIANQWSLIGNDIETIDIELIDAFYDSLNQFKQSELYRMYYSIPYSSEVKNSLTPFNIGLPITENSKEIEGTIENMRAHAIVLRASIISQDWDKVQAVSKDISSEVIIL